MQRKIYTARLLRSDSLSDQTKHLEFEVRDEPRFDFTPGQFISMLAPKEGKTITRAYSVASAPRDHHLDICLNRVENGFFSNLLCDMGEGQELGFHGPHGLFVLRNPLRDSIFIATGTGIAPMRAFVQWLFTSPAPAKPAGAGGPVPDAADPSIPTDAQAASVADPEVVPADAESAGEQSRAAGREIFLVYGTRYEKDIYYREYFAEVARRHPNFHYLITLSRDSDAWLGARGYVQEHVRQIVASRPPELRTSMDAYICGLNDMVSANRKLLQEEFGWEKKSVIYERYD